MLHARRRRHAFTLIELLVVIGVIALLVGLLVPSLASARENGRITKCQSNLRQLAIASQSYANANRGFLSSGAWDNQRDEGRGSLDTTGWVADQVNGQYGLPGKMLCPSSPSQATQSLSPGRVNASNAFKLFSQPELENLIDAGFNTNYCQSWYMSHTDLKEHRVIAGNSPGSWKDPARTRGPLADHNMLNSSPDRVPLFGDGHVQLGEGDIDRVFYRGQILAGAKSLTDGPVAMVNPPGIAGLGAGRQRYEDLGPTHGRGGPVIDGVVNHDRVLGNIVFADAHVAIFRDNGLRDGRWSGEGGSKNGFSGVLIYNELEGKVFGGWLTRPGLAW